MELHGVRTETMQEWDALYEKRESSPQLALRPEAVEVCPMGLPIYTRGVRNTTPHHWNY